MTPPGGEMQLRDQHRSVRPGGPGHSLSGELLPGQTVHQAISPYGSR